MRLAVVGGVVFVCFLVVLVFFQAGNTDKVPSSSIRRLQEEIAVLKQSKDDLENKVKSLSKLATKSRAQAASAIATFLRDQGEPSSYVEPVVSSPTVAECPEPESCPSCPATTSAVPALSGSSENNPSRAWEQFGMSNRELECDAIFGVSLVDKWREHPENHCSSKQGGGSSLTCYQHRQVRHSGPDIMCSGTNIAFDFSKPKRANKASTYGEDGHFTFPEGFMLAACEQQSAFSLSKFPMSQKDMMSGLSFVSNLPTCTQRIQHTLLPVTRYEYKNLFHQMTDFVNAFMVAMLAGVDMNDIQIVLLDNHPIGPFLDMWRALAPSHPVLRVDDLSSATLCADRVLFPVLGYGAPIAKDIARSNECPDASLVQAFIRHVLRNMNLLDTPIPSEPSITLISRKDYDGRALSRKITNEDEVAQAIRQRLRGGTFRQIDFASISFKEQLEVIRSTNILIGMHGAGLSHLLFLPKEAIVIELFQGDMPKHYRNFAKWSDKRYMSYSAGSTVNVGDFMQMLDGAVRMSRSFNEQHASCGMAC